MRKTYRYRNLQFIVVDDEDVWFTIEFVSDGNTGETFVDIPGEDDPNISDEGTVLLGKGADLRSEITVCVSDIANPIPEEDEIIVRYKINDQILVEHKNPKTESERPWIVLSIQFPES